MIISLTGFMGCGKSSVGKALAGRLGWEFTDLDEYIIHKKGMSIPEIFEQEGEEAFRAVEAECLRDVVVMHQIAGGDAVLALGGGTMCITSVRGLILNQTECFWLKASLQNCLKRIGLDTTSRPILKMSVTEAPSVEELFAERERIYSLAPHYINTDNSKEDDVVDIIRREYGLRTVTSHIPE